MKVTWEDMISTVDALKESEKGEYERFDELVKDCNVMSHKAAMFTGSDVSYELWIPLSLMRVGTDGKLYLENWKYKELFGE